MHTLSLYSAVFNHMRQVDQAEADGITQVGQGFSSFAIKKDVGNRLQQAGGTPAFLPSVNTVDGMAPSFLIGDGVGTDTVCTFHDTFAPLAIQYSKGEGFVCVVQSISGHMVSFYNERKGNLKEKGEGSRKVMHYNG